MNKDFQNQQAIELEYSTGVGYSKLEMLPYTLSDASIKHLYGNAIIAYEIKQFLHNRGYVLITVDFNIVKRTSCATASHISTYKSLTDEKIPVTVAVKGNEFKSKYTINDVWHKVLHKEYLLSLKENVLGLGNTNTFNCHIGKSYEKNKG